MHKPDAWCHRVDRVLGFFSPVARIGTPHPLTHRRVCTPFWFRGATPACGRGGGGGGPISDDGADTVVI